MGEPRSSKANQRAGPSPEASQVDADGASPRAVSEPEQAASPQPQSRADPGTADQAERVDDLSAEPADALVADLEDRWRRAAADLDNLRKRYARELDRERAAERRRVAAAFLPVLDNLELALAHAQAEPSTIVEGVRHVLEQGIGVLAGLGFPREDKTGVAFDPNRHEVARVVDEPGAEPGIVVEVLRAGYGDGPSQLRPATVAVCRGTGA